MARYAIDPSGVMAAFGQLGQSRALLQQRNDIETERVRRQRQQRATEALSLIGAGVGFGLGGAPGASLGMTVGAGVAGAAGGEHIPPSQLLSMGLQAYGLYDNAQTKAGNADVNQTQIDLARENLTAQQQQLQELVQSGQATGAGDQVSPALDAINAKIATLDKIKKAGNLGSINPASIGALLERMKPSKADLIPVAPGTGLWNPQTRSWEVRNPKEASDDLKPRQLWVRPSADAGWTPISVNSDATVQNVQTRFGLENVLLQDPNTAGKQSFDKETELRKEFLQQNKDFAIVRDSFSNIQAAGKRGTAAGDMSLIYNFMRMQDPNSTVREGEYATAKDAAGIPERLRNLYNKAIDGQFLTKEQRADFVGQSADLYTSRLKGYQKTTENYRNLADQYGVDRKRVVLDLQTQSPEEIENSLKALTDTRPKSSTGDGASGKSSGAFTRMPDEDLLNYVPTTKKELKAQDDELRRRGIKK